MWARTGFRRETYDLITSSFQDQRDSTNPRDPLYVSSSSSSSSSSSEESHDEDEDQESYIASRQLVLYNQMSGGPDAIEQSPGPTMPNDYQPPEYPRIPGFLLPNRVLPSVGHFTVQCANCFKWRLIPTKAKYEEIREHILEQPFYCETAREWQPDVSCDDPPDILQDNSRLWAIDKPNIAQAPPGWERLLRIRGEGSTKFADVYYVAPSGKRLRSMVEIQKHFLQHPEDLREGVSLSKFSFQTPKPLQENYVRKRSARSALSSDCNRPSEVTPSPLSWVDPNSCTDSQLARPALPPPFLEVPVLDDSVEQRSAKRQKATATPNSCTDSQLPSFALPPPFVEVPAADDSVEQRSTKRKKATATRSKKMHNRIEKVSRNEAEHNGEC